MADKNANDADLPQRDAGGNGNASGRFITGRSFTGASSASDQHEQAVGHPGESQRHRAKERRERPAKKS